MVSRYEVAWTLAVVGLLAGVALPEESQYLKATIPSLSSRASSAG